MKIGSPKNLEGKNLLVGISAVDSNGNAIGSDITTLKNGANVTFTSSANGVLVIDARSVTSVVKLIPSSASEITLSDGTYAHVPDVSPTYTLPAVSDNTVTHTVFLSVSMTNTASFSFQDTSGNIIAPSLSGRDPAVGEFWQFMCEYSILQGKWMVLGYKED